jgi:hypothetical protein
MSDDLTTDTPRSVASAAPSEDATLGKSSLYKLFEAFIALREKNERQHKLFEQTLTKSRDAIQTSFNSFAADTQRAYQQLRQEIHGEKKVGLAMLNELVDIAQEMEHLVAARPQVDLTRPEDEPLRRWIEAVEVQNRKVQAAMRRHGIHRYDAVIGSAYRPDLHERVGSRRMEGMDAYRVAEQREPGYASQQPEFVLRRPKVIVSE